MNTKVVIGIVLALIVIGGLYFYTNNQQANNLTYSLIQQRKVEGKITKMEDGWSQYKSDHWSLEFQFPSHWKLTEWVYKVDRSLETGESLPVGKLAVIRLKGDGYQTDFSSIGKGIPTDANTKSSTYTVAGRTVWVFRDKTNLNAYVSFIKSPVCNQDNEFGVSIWTPTTTNTSSMVNKILSSIRCSE
ncbi:hypothetical protein C4585_01105 [Candidatus Parcubacteria bacterium]|nr:MAG: hypothetical protein C4585_01105 [Candidatus Parcubacteria bacterium]